MFVALSRLGSFGLVWLALGLAAALFYRRPALFPIVTAAVLASDMLALAGKVASGRTRPYVEDPQPPPLLHTPLELSFPSGHAATSFAGATLLSLLVPRAAPGLLALAAAIAFSRVYVGVHYPGDVLAGAVLGAAVGGTAFFLATRPVRRAARALRWPRGGPPRSPRPPRRG